jgi:hypothetical protein
MTEFIIPTNATVVGAAKHVTISDVAITALLAVEGGIGTDFSGLLSRIEVDSDEWHYSLDAKSFGPLTAQYTLVLDSLNFCFWPCPGLEYEHLAKGLKAMLMNDPHAFDADRLKVVDEVNFVSFR